MTLSQYLTKSIGDQRQGRTTRRRNEDVHDAGIRAVRPGHTDKPHSRLLVLRQRYYVFCAIRKKMAQITIRRSAQPCSDRLGNCTPLLFKARILIPACDSKLQSVFRQKIPKPGYYSILPSRSRSATWFGIRGPLRTASQSYSRSVVHVHQRAAILAVDLPAPLPRPVSCDSCCKSPPTPHSFYCWE